MYLLAAQILDRADLLFRDDMRFRGREAENVMDALVEIGCRALGAEEFEHIRLRDRDVDAAQVEQVFEVGGGALGDERHHAQIFAVGDRKSTRLNSSHLGISYAV